MDRNEIQRRSQAIADEARAIMQDSLTAPDEVIVARTEALNKAVAELSRVVDREVGFDDDV